MCRSVSVKCYLPANKRMPYTSAAAALCPKFPPSQPTKNFPRDPATHKKRNKIPSSEWRGHGGSSRRVWEVWRERGASFKRRPSPSKVFPSPLQKLIKQHGSRTRYCRERPMCRSVSVKCYLPANKKFLTQVRQPHPAKNPHLPSKPKTSPVTPPLIKNETKFLPLSGGVMGEVLGGCGRFGGRGSPLSRGLPLPPKVFPSSPRSSSLHSPLQPKGSEGGVTENGFQSGQQVTGYGERAPKQNAAGETAAAVKRQIRAVGIYLP